MLTERRPTVDADLLALLERARSLEAASHQWDLPEAQRRRQVSEQAAASLPRLLHRGLTRTDVYAVADGREIPIRLYRPASMVGRPAALLPYIHGGGWVVGSIATHDTLCAELAARTGYVVASIHYRRAPEHPCPAQHEDIQEAIAWLLRHAKALDLNADLPMALGGDSAGAHLALGCAYRAAHEAPGRYDRLLLFYPALDPGMSSDSARIFADGPGLTRAAMQYYWNALLGSSVPHALTRLALPLTWARGMPLLPATVLVTAETDMLRDEGEAYAHRLRMAGVKVAHWHATGMVHGFARMLAASPAARGQVRLACHALMNIL